MGVNHISPFPLLPWFLEFDPLSHCLLINGALDSLDLSPWKIRKGITYLGVEQMTNVSE